MKFGVCSLVVGGSVLALLGARKNSGVERRAPRSIEACVASAKTAQPRAVEDYGKLPLSFEVNQGQTDGQVRFLARGQGYTLFLTSEKAVLALHKSEGKRVPKEVASVNPGSKLAADSAGRLALFEDGSPRAAKLSESKSGEGGTNTALQMRLVGASSDARVKGEDELPGKSNYFIGKDPKKWRTNIPTYAKVRVEDVYPGVDLVYYGNQGQLEYDFVVQPAADPSAIRLAFASTPPPTRKGFAGSRDSVEASSVKIADNGDLMVQADGGEIRLQKPVIYQQRTASDEAKQATGRIPVRGRYAIDEQNEVVFAISDYDKSKPLVIDPILFYSIYLGGSQQEQGYGIAVDAETLAVNVTATAGGTIRDTATTTSTTLDPTTANNSATATTSVI